MHNSRWRWPWTGREVLGATLEVSSRPHCLLHAVKPSKLYPVITEQKGQGPLPLSPEGSEGDSGQRLSCQLAQVCTCEFHLWMERIPVVCHFIPIFKHKATGNEEVLSCQVDKAPTWDVVPGTWCRVLALACCVGPCRSLQLKCALRPWACVLVFR